jgi:DNA replication protein DnaC
MTSTNDLTPLLKRLKLGAVLNTLPERLALARREQLDYAAFLQIILADEVTRREQRRLEIHLQKAGFEEICRLEDFDLNAQQSNDLYELIISRHRRTSFVITSNRAVDEWLGLFDDPILGNSALDRLANASYQIVIEGTSYRERLSPHRREELTP